MDNPEINLPENADKLLFAEDVVSYVMTHLYFNPYEGTRATPYRDFIFTAFNDAVRVAINDIGNRLIFQNCFIYDAIDRISEPNENIYQEIIEKLTDYYKTDGFDPRIFIVYCCNVSIVGAIMRNNGFHEAADMAISAIYEFIKDIDMLNTGWKTLTVLSSTFYNERQEINSILTPQSLSPDIDGLFTDTEEEDSQMSSSDERDSEMSSSDERDSAQHNENNIETPTDENEIKVNLADALGVTINPCSVSIGSFCVPTRKEPLQPSATGEVVMKGETESTKPKMSTCSVNDLFQIKNVKYENYLTSSLPTEEISSQTVDSIEEDKTSTLATDANSEAGKYLTDPKELKADSEALRKSLELKDNTSQLPTSRECNIFSDDNCIITKQQGNSD